jgi:anti-sigma factor ChrR (cupin superfamily)
MQNGMASVDVALEQGAHTPHLRGEDELDPGLSRYVDVADLPWKPTQSAGIEMKILLQDKSTGLMTALFRWQPGARLAMHEHVEIEQSYVLEGSIVDDEGEATAGNYVWRPRGHKHYAVSPNGALILSMFLRPNIFLEEFAGEVLE